MVDTVVESLIPDLLDWLTQRERTYDEFMDAWHTSCPKLPVWEEANDRALIQKVERNGRTIVEVTPAGLALLADYRRRP
jgi:hypothetical protein